MDLLDELTTLDAGGAKNVMKARRKTVAGKMAKAAKRDIERIQKNLERAQAMSQPAIHTGPQMKHHVENSWGSFS